MKASDENRGAANQLLESRIIVVTCCHLVADSIHLNE
jgi:hypothetical protein